MDSSYIGQMFSAEQKLNVLHMLSMHRYNTYTIQKRSLLKITQFHMYVSCKKLFKRKELSACDEGTFWFSLAVFFLSTTAGIVLMLLLEMALDAEDMGRLGRLKLTALSLADITGLHRKFNIHHSVKQRNTHVHTHTHTPHHTCARARTHTHTHTHMHTHAHTHA